MDRKKIEDALIESRYGDGTGADLSGPDVEAAKSEMAALDSLLSLSEDEPPRPGFDTRFFAQLEEMKRESQEAPSWIRRLTWILAPVGLAAAVLVVVQVNSSNLDKPNNDQLAIAMELELFEEYETVRELDVLEDFELLAQLTLEDLEVEPSEPADAEEVRVQ